MVPAIESVLVPTPVAASSIAGTTSGIAVGASAGVNTAGASASVSTSGGVTAVGVSGDGSIPGTAPSANPLKQLLVKLLGSL